MTDQSDNPEVDQFLTAASHPACPSSDDETQESPSGARSGSRFSAPGHAASLTEKAGSVIGRYTLVKQIGVGGFGVVYMADQREPVQRKVALKIIKLGMDTRDVIGRFEAERQALAMMDHPHIAKVLDAGATDAGRPYFVMELVHGVPITKFCDANNLGLRERLALFNKVCGAVQHAHQKGIIHRDIKPGNILVTHVDDKPVPKVIDFGIAKATQQKLTEYTMFTQIGQFMGTPAYMSPEQAEPHALDIDTRTDIYSLGVVLYELVSGTMPFDIKTFRAAAVDDLKKMIREQDPPKPSTRLAALGENLPIVAQQRGVEPKKLGTILRGDLDWVIMKAMEKDRTRRYESASGLAMDIERYLNHEPVEASPPSAAYRFRKFARRNRTTLTMAAVVAIAVLAGLVVSAYGLVRATRERDAKIQALAATESALMREQSALKEQQKARTESDAVAAFLEKMLLAASPHEQGRDATVRSVVDAAAEGLATQFADQPLVKARINFVIASTYGSLGLYQEAEKHARVCMETRRKHLGNDHPDTLASVMALAWHLHDQGRLDEAEPYFVEMREHAAKAGQSEDSNILWSKNQLATAHMNAGRYPEAEALYKEALTIFERVLGKRDRRTLSLMNNLLVLYWNQGRLGPATELARETYSLLIEVFGPEDPLTISMRINLAILEYTIGNFARSEEMYLEALALQIRVVGETNVTTVSIKSNLATLYKDMKQYDKAESMALDVLSPRPGSLPQEHQLMLAARINLGLVYLESGRLERAIETFQEVLPAILQKLGTRHPWTWEAQSGLYEALERAGKSQEATAVRMEFLSNLKTACTSDEADANALDRLARLLIAEKQPTPADVQEALSTAQRAVERSTRQNAAHLHTLATALKLAGDGAAAMQAEREAIALLPEGSVHRAEYESMLAEFQGTSDQ